MVRREAMSRIYKSLPPKGTALGIAFSGGLDTRCAVAWLAAQGLDVYAYTADLAQPDEKNPADIPPIAMQHGAVKAKLIDCRESMVREGLVAIQCGAFHLVLRRQEVLQHHAARARRDHHRHRARDARGRGARLRRRLHAQGQRHPALLPLRDPGRPRPAHLQAVARPGVRHRVRRAHRDERVPRAASACPTRWAPRRPTPPTRTCSARPTRRRISSASTSACASSQPIMGVAFWKTDVEIDAEEVTVDLRARRAGRDQRQDASPRRSSCSSRPTASAAATASA